MFPPARLAMRVVLAPGSQDQVWRREALGDETWKDIMQSFAAEHSMSEHGLTFWVGDRAMSPGELVKSASAQSDEQEHMIALSATAA